MDRTGNKRVVRQLLRACREEFRANGHVDCGKLLELYKILVNMCRSARIIDDEGLCILGEHQDEWESCAKGNEQLRHAVADWLNTLRNGLKGDDGVDVSSAFSKFCDVIAAEKHANSQSSLKDPSTVGMACAMSDKKYEEILLTIKNAAMTWECTPNSYRYMGEEDLRNALLASLNGCFPGKANGETFRKNGKTDICIETEDRTAFVAECKIWTGAGDVPKALAQLDSYLTWRDCKTALIYFVTRKNFLAIIDKMQAVLSGQKNLLGVRALDRNEFVCKMPSSRTPGHMINIRVLLFNLHSDEDKKGASK